MILHHTLDMSLSNCVKYVAGFGLTMGSGPFVGHADGTTNNSILTQTNQRRPILVPRKRRAMLCIVHLDTD